MHKFAGKTVFITGATSGIGRACAEQFAAGGAKLILAARRQDRLNTLAEDFTKQYGTQSQLITLDVRDRKQVESVLQNFPSDIDILLNNAGLAAGLASVAESDVDDWDQMIDTNIKGLLYVTKCLLPNMITRNSGHIINIGSIAGHEVYPNGAVYCATKHAVNAFTRGLKMDLLGTQLRVTSIDPGMVETEFSLVRFKGDADKAQQVYKNMTPLSPDDIADSILYCASRPAHVNISEMIILATDQSAATLVSRKK